MQICAFVSLGIGRDSGVSIATIDLTQGVLLSEHTARTRSASENDEIILSDVRATNSDTVVVDDTLAFEADRMKQVFKEAGLGGIHLAKGRISNRDNHANPWTVIAEGFANDPDFEKKLVWMV